MSDWREESSREAREDRQTGPFGSEGDEETRRIPRPEPEREPDREPERSVSERRERSGEGARRARREPSGPLGWDEEPETREVRPRRNRPSPNWNNRDSGGTREWVYQPEPAASAEEMSREDRLRELYGGVDWLASFVGTVFGAVAGTVMFLIVGAGVLAPLQLSPALRSGDFSANVYAGLAVVGVVLFLGYFFGGYVSGRLARFDGGRNGLMVVLWTFIFAALVVVTGGVLGNFISGSFFEALRARMLQVNEVLANSFDQLGTVEVAIIAGGLLVSVLGAFLGGRLGERYHSDIDQAV